MRITHFLVLASSVFFSVQSIAQEDSNHYELTDKVGSTVFNPHPMTDDLILPLPCRNSNYHMVFRKVYTNPPSDQDFTSSFSFYDGTENARNAAVQSKRQCRVRGSFSDEGGSFFYIAKYELTQGQYDAIVHGKCRDMPSKTEAIAKSGISIDEAREVSRLYSDFLQTVSNAPKVHGEKASATLPYECFWSFAQRGGLAVSKNQLEQDLPHMDNGFSLKDYAWGFGADSSNGKVQLIGQKRPSELGLFDMLGNVQEFMDEPFQATETDELSAQKGGSTVRGGSILTPFFVMTSSLRTEKKRYTNGKPTRSKDTGMRLMLNVSVILDPKELKKIESDILNKRGSQALENNSPQEDTNFLRPEEAVRHIGEFRNVCGVVSQGYEQRGHAFLNFGDLYPNHIFSIYLSESDEYPAVNYLSGRKICALGTIGEYRGIPQIANPISLEIMH